MGSTLPGTPYVVEVNPRIPERLARLEDLAGDLWYSFDRPTRELFARLHPTLWNAVVPTLLTRWVIAFLE